MKRSTTAGQKAAAGRRRRPSTQRLGPPTTHQEALEDGRNALRLASTLIRQHRTAPNGDPKKSVLRGAISMVWIALICGCQAILLARAPGARARGGPQDIRAARKVAATIAERDYVAAAAMAEADLYERGFVRADLDADEVEAWLRTARAELARQRRIWPSP